MLFLLFLVELQPARNRYAEDLRDQVRIALLGFAVFGAIWTRSVIRRRHAVGADLYVVDALPPSSPWPTIAATIAASVIGAAVTLLTHYSG